MLLSSLLVKSSYFGYQQLTQSRVTQSRSNVIKRFGALRILGKD